LYAGRLPSGRALAVKVEPSIFGEVSPPDGASIPDAEPCITAADLTPALRTAFLIPGRSVAKIQLTVADFYDISPTYMTEPDGRDRGMREPKVARPRQVAMFFARKLTPMTLPAIGKRFGGRDHTTVIHAIRVVEKRAKQDPAFRLELQTLRERLEA
jgi:chromosomal replication initiation ATPase DnaA